MAKVSVSDTLPVSVEFLVLRVELGVGSQQL